MVAVILFFVGCSVRAMKEMLAEWRGERVPPPDATMPKEYFPKSFSVDLMQLEEKELVSTVEGVVLLNYTSSVRRHYTLREKPNPGNPIVISAVKFTSEDSALSHWYRFESQILDYITARKNFARRKGKSNFLTLQEIDKRIILARALSWSFICISVPLVYENAEEIIQALDSDFLRHFQELARE